MSDTEFNWLIAHPEEAQKYPGECIAIVGEFIVAHGKDFKAARGILILTAPRRSFKR